MPGDQAIDKEVARLNEGLKKVLALPRGAQYQAINQLRQSLDHQGVQEAWNTNFQADSLYQAWSEFSVMQDLYEANKKLVRNTLDARGPGWQVVEIGGGNGRLWRHALRPDDRGTLVLVDPVTHVHKVVAELLPAGVKLISKMERAENLTQFPEADLLVCSLTLHHVPGIDRQDLKRRQMQGPGKLEVLQSIARMLKPRSGIGILNEADIHCDIDLPPNSEVLANNMVDSYVRRTACTLMEDIRTRADADPQLRRRWAAIVRLWCLDQMEMVAAPLAQRDVYELNVGEWLQLLDRAGLEVTSHQFTDPICLFHQYVFQNR